MRLLLWAFIKTAKHCEESISSSPPSYHSHFYVGWIYLTVTIEDSIIIILVLPPDTCQSSDRALPMPGTADGDAISRCQVLGRAGSVHHAADPYILHGLPDVTVTSFWVVWISPSLHCDMFTLDRSTCVRNRFSAFQVVQGFSTPAGRCSSALMHAGVQGLESFSP